MLTTVLSFVLFHLFTVEGASGQCGGEDEAAGAQWTYCGRHHKDSSDSPEEVQDECIIPSSINEGFISYGRDKRFILIPFSNYGGSDLRILCNAAFGDIHISSDFTEPDQYCCYSNNRAMNNQFGNLTFPVSNKINYNEDRNLMYEAVIESYNPTTSTIGINSYSYNLVSGIGHALIANTKMLTGQALISPNKQFAAVIESDGGLSVYRITDAHKLWTAPGSSGTGNNNYLHYTSEGELILYKSDGTVVWAIRRDPNLKRDDGTDKWTAGTVQIYDDSNLSIRNHHNEWLWGCINHVWPWSWSNAPAIVRYGANNKFTYRAFTNSKLRCHHDVGFGNMLESGKECHWTYDNKAAGITDIGHYTEWVSCGYDGVDCTGLTNNIPQWVRFGGGDDGIWEYQLILTGDNRIQCNAGVFNYWDFEGLTHNVQGKRCERAKTPQREFYDIIGSWSAVSSCSGNGCGEQEYKLKYGRSRASEYEITHEWGLSLTKTASGNYKMFGASQELTMSYNVAVRSLTSELFEEEKELTISCGGNNQNNFVWQWITNAKEFIPTKSRDITIRSKDYLCRSSPEQPTCAPGYC